MAIKRGRSSRRSFLAQVAGGAVTLGATGIVTGASAQVRTWSATEAACASGVTDSDGGPDADPVGNGRGTGVSDSDSGATADPAGQGRGTGTGVSDSDSGETADPAGQGRGHGEGGVTDRDSGAHADPAGEGRGRVRITDSDVGFHADPIGRGQGGGRERPVPPVNCPPRNEPES
tara:strand:+ start:45 stop:569 length:525 start_codon:yes stop_codon:yes gene_type:complete